VNVSVLLLVVAIVCFVLAALSVGVGSVALVPLGLAFFCAAHLPI
jgi:hypothetical protein